jgi:valyl-tRNA synthetase
LALGFGGPAAAAGNLFCCVDASGKHVCGDILPHECYGRAYRELGDSGRTLRNVEAPLTAEQRAQRAIEDERRKQEEAARREVQRKDQALLNTYASEADIEVMRSRAQEDVFKSINAAEAKIAEIRAQRKTFENEAEFYKKKQLPPDVQKGLRDADFEIKAQESVIEAKMKELAIIRVKYDEDRRRFIDLSRRGASPR